MLVDVVHSNQTYTVSSYTIFDNLDLVWDYLQLGCRDVLSFTLLALDQEKAFIRVNPGYFLGTWWVFGFRPWFMGFIQVLNASADCSSSTGPFLNLSSSVEGCISLANCALWPLSPSSISSAIG